MAHNLNFNSKTGQYSFFSVKEKAWHGLGQIVQEYPTSAEAIKYAGLDYEVVKIPLVTGGAEVSITEDGELIDLNNISVPDQFATVRKDTKVPFGTVGKDYHIIQNREAFAFFDEIVGGDGILYETAGALGNGERIFITAKLPGYIRVGNGDDITEKYIFLTTAHDGSGSITAAFTPIRIVCANTLNAALHDMSNVVRIKHTSGAKQRLADAHKIMKVANTLSDELQDIFNNWTKVKVTDSEVRKLIQLALSPNKEATTNIKKGIEEELSTVFKNQVDDAFAYAMMSDTQQMETTKGTLFGAYNAVTGYFQNVCSYQDQEQKLQSIVLGGSALTKTQRAFDLCSSFEKTGTDTFQLN